MVTFVGMRHNYREANNRSGSHGLTASPTMRGPVHRHNKNDILSLQIAIKCADLGHNCEKRAVHVRWVAKVQAEFWGQGDLERGRGMKVPAMNDRNLHSHATEAASQVAFQELFCTPLFNSLGCAFPGTLPLAQQSWDNLCYWRERGRKVRQGEAVSRTCSLE